MTNIHSNPTPLRQKFIEYLTLNRKAERTVHTYVSFIYSLAKHCRRSPDLLGPEDIRQWLYYLIAEDFPFGGCSRESVSLICSTNPLQAESF
jgi:hypothetical protein